MHTLTKNISISQLVDQQADITVVIPTYNRPAFLTRLIAYYASKKSHINFLVLDSSNDQNKKLNQAACDVLGNQCCYEKFDSTMPVAEKLLAGLKMVSTQYCAFCADDDLVFIDGLLQALDYLKSHPDYTCVDGIYLNFNPHGKDINLFVEYATRGIEAQDPGARLFKLYQKYESLFYGVYRTEHAVKIFSGVANNDSLHFQELFQSSAALLLGKSHRLPIFYAARQHCEPAEKDRDNWQTYYWFADNTNQFFEHYLKYREVLWSFFQHNIENHGYSQASFYKMMDLVHAMYFSMGCPPEYFFSRLQEYWPTDSYAKPKRLNDDVCTLLKSKKRQKFESLVDTLAEKLPKKLSSLYSPLRVWQLNKQTKKQTTGKWNCKLSPDLRWLSGVDHFRKAYLELCHYMDKAANTAQ